MKTELNIHFYIVIFLLGLLALLFASHLADELHQQPRRYVLQRQAIENLSR